MSAERDFSSFQLGDNVHELAGGLVPEIAERLGIALSSEPNTGELGQLVGAIGKNKVLRDNEELEAIDRDTAVGFVECSGVQERLNRALWTPEKRATNANVDAIVISGGVANWQDRTADLVAHSPAYHKPVYAIAGNRVMSTATEKINSNIKEILEVFGRYPTEAEYTGSVIVPQLVETGRWVLPTSYPTGNGDEIADRFFEDNPGLLERKLVFARVANAGVQLAVQMRKAARKQAPDFDSDPSSPQVFVMTDSFPLAKTAEQESDPANYQKGATALRQVALTAKMLHEAAGGE